MVSIQDFSNIDLRVARILEAAPHPNADRLWVLKIDIGEEAPRQIVAGIKAHYSAESLVGKNIAVVANLEPAVIRGVESKGMLLAAKNPDGLTLLTTERADFAPGSKIG